jgi:GxxExxY protein
MQQRQEPSFVVDQLAHRVIGAAIEVHRELGPGFQERVYQEALAFELETRAIPFAREVPIPLRYKGRPLTTLFRLDLVVGGLVVVELKAVDHLSDAHLQQTLAYLAASGHPLGLLLNFNCPVLKSGIRRVIPWRTPP